MRTRQLLIALAIASGLAVIAARAGPPEEYAAGDAAYRRGDVASAIASLRPAADAGHAKAQVLLGSILDAAGQDEEAVRYLAMAAGQGDAEGAYLLSGMYESGEGVARDPAKARQLLEMAAGQGHRDSTFTMAAAYLGGGLGLTQEDRKSPAALAWIRKASAEGHLPSVDRLAVAFRKGDYGLAVDVKMAEEMEARARSIRGIAARTTPARKRAPARVPGGG